ncbi:MAG: biotin synthase BioB [Planctomycetes bacterium]|nr:biotin synthase BioB [Planctomycetota bacterium]
MIDSNASLADTQQGAAEKWDALASSVLAGHRLTEAEALSVLACPDDELLSLLAATFRVRRQHFGKSVQLYFLVNAKSGLCPEDCGYCSQSKVSDAPIQRYRMMSAEKLLEGARVAHEQQSRTYCIVLAGRGPTDAEMRAMTDIVPRIKQAYDLKICACMGLLTPDQAERLKECGVDRVNHNLNTSEEHYPQICSTHTYQDRLDTLRAVRNAGLEICSGGIIGMGERTIDLVRMAFELRELEAESIPINFLNPIDGTPLAGRDDLDPRYCLKALAMFRLVNPASELRIGGGREMHLGTLQPLALYAANSVFIGDYLTTAGQPAKEDYRMIEELGFQVTRAVEPATVCS